MISGWRRERRIGPVPLLERLRDHFVALAYALAAACILTPLLIWIKYGWPPNVSPTGWVFVWCGMFSLMMLQVIWPYASAGLWRHLLVLILVAAGIVVLVWRLAMPTYAAVICMRMACVYPVAP